MQGSLSVKRTSFETIQIMTKGALISEEWAC